MARTKKPANTTTHTAHKKASLPKHSLQQHPKVVRLNVGGNRYELSRDLLMEDEKTMLAKLVSDTWLKNKDDPDLEVFIDRDGETFRHVLQYLRHKQITLPKEVSKDSFLKELDYYGINFERGSVKTIGQNFYDEAAKEYRELEKEIQEKKQLCLYLKKDIRQCEKLFEIEKGHLLAATKILSFYHDYVKNKNTHVIQLVNGDNCYVLDLAGNIFYNLIEETKLNKYLENFGLRVNNWRSNNCSVTELQSGQSEVTQEVPYASIA